MTPADWLYVASWLVMVAGMVALGVGASCLLLLAERFWAYLLLCQARSRRYRATR